MEPQLMQPVIAVVPLGDVFVLLYFACVIAVTIYVLLLMTRFVSAHERMAASLDVIARKLKDESNS